MKDNTPQPERTVPKPVRHVQSGVIFRSLTFKERMMILFGCNIGIEAHIATQHNPGFIQPLLNIHIVAQKTLEAAEKEIAQKVKELKAEADRAQASDEKEGE